MSDDQSKLNVVSGKGLIQPGDQGPGLVCHHCRSAFPIVATPEAIDALSDPLQAECPKCRRTGTYPKAEIRTLRAHRKQ
jgi:hypothetical protein